MIRKHTKRLLPRIIRIKITILVIAILPIVVLTLLTSRTDKIIGLQSFVVLTGSMEPNIKQGSLVFTKKQQNYTTGDVIAYTAGNVTITHRIVGVEKSGGILSYQTRGDANNTPDNTLVSTKSVIGKAENSIPYVGSFILFLKTIPGFLTFIVLPVLIFIGFELWNIKREIEIAVEKKVKEKFGLQL